MQPFSLSSYDITNIIKYEEAHHHNEGVFFLPDTHLVLIILHSENIQHECTKNHDSPKGEKSIIIMPYGTALSHHFAPRLVRMMDGVREDLVIPL